MNRKGGATRRRRRVFPLMAGRECRRPHTVALPGCRCGLLPYAVARTHLSPLCDVLWRLCFRYPGKIAARTTLLHWRRIDGLGCNTGSLENGLSDFRTSRTDSRETDTAYFNTGPPSGISGISGRSGPGRSGRGRSAAGSLLSLCGHGSLHPLIFTSPELRRDWK
jgi:hypothetical protein